MEEHRPRKLLDLVRACPGLDQGMPSATQHQDGQRTHPSSPHILAQRGAHRIAGLCGHDALPVYTILEMLCRRAA